MKQEFGKESISFVVMGKIRNENGQLENLLRFTIKCLKIEVIPVSMRLKTNVKTFKDLQIIRKAEK